MIHDSFGFDDNAVVYMNSENSETINTDNDGRYVNILAYLLVIVRHKRLIVRFSLVATLLAVVVLFLVLPRWYKSTTTLMPPKQKNTLGLLSSIARASSPFRNLGIGGSSDDLVQLQAILNSRRCLEAVVDRFELSKVYRSENKEEAVKELRSNISVGIGEEDVLIEVAAYDTDPQQAADMANYFVDVLNTIFIEMSTAEARSNREFLEKRYQQNLEDLSNAEDTLRVFQERHGVYSIPEQMKAAVQFAAGLQTQLTLKEIELAILEKTTTADNIARQSVVLEMEALKHELSSMNTRPTGGGTQYQLFPSFAKAPGIGMEYLRNFREVEIQSKLLELLLPLYEQAKIEEQRNTPSVVVLDNAVPAIKASKPKRLLLTIAACMGSVIIGVLLAFILEYFQRARALEGDEAKKIDFIRKELNLRRLFQ